MLSLFDRLHFNLMHFLYALFNKLGRADFFKTNYMDSYYARLNSALEKRNTPLPLNGDVLTIKNPASLIGKLDKVILIPKGCYGWPAHKKWSFNYLENNFGHVTLRSSKSSSDLERCQVPLSEIFSRMREGEDTQTIFEPLVEKTPALKKDLRLDILRKWISKGPNFNFPSLVFMNKKGYISPFHMDISSNILLNVCGIRDVKLYSFTSTPFIYPKPQSPTVGYAFFSHIPKEAAFDEKLCKEFPLFKFAKEFRVTLFPGDILFIPAMTWHVVRYVEDCIGVACGFRHLPLAIKASPFFTMLATRKYLETFSLK